MKREIKFRGLRTNGKGWVIGSLAYLFDDKLKPYIMPSCNSAQAAFMDGAGLALGGFVPVIPETVGQFTGLRDRNGKEVFEGDKSNLTEVVFERGMFQLMHVSESGTKSFIDIHPRFTVTGNIHEQ